MSTTSTVPQNGTSGVSSGSAPVPESASTPSTSTSAGDFSSIPILDYRLLSTPAGRAQFLSELRHALINVGFLYLLHPPVSPALVSSLITTEIPQLFALPQEEKDKVAMRESPHFLGYSRLGAELTKGRVDRREQWDFATEHACRWKEGEGSNGEGDPEYWRLWGPCQWPSPTLLPSFRPTFTQYLAEVEALSYEFARLISEAFGLGSHGLDRFYDDMTSRTMQHRAKVVKYPCVKVKEGGNGEDGDGEGQGVGPHYDAGFLTFLLQASPHAGLQVQNLAGEWIDAPPLPDTFVVNIGKALEFVTGGLARATSHRVLSPRSRVVVGDNGDGNVGMGEDESGAGEDESGEGEARYSVPFFQNIGLDVRLAECVLEFPPEILALKDARGSVAKTDSVNFTEFDREPSGKVNLIGRVKSHPDVAERHYPELFKQYFPDGLPQSGKGSAY